MKKYLIILFVLMACNHERQHQTKTWKPNDSYCIDGIKYYAHGHAVFPAYDKTTKEVVTCEEK